MVQSSSVHHLFPLIMRRSLSLTLQNFVWRPEQDEKLSTVLLMNSMNVNIFTSRQKNIVLTYGQVGISRFAILLFVNEIIYASYWRLRDWRWVSFGPSRWRFCCRVGCRVCRWTQRLQRLRMLLRPSVWRGFGSRANIMVAHGCCVEEMLGYVVELLRASRSSLLSFTTHLDE